MYVVPVVKNPTCQCRRHKRSGFKPRVWKIPWRRAWQPTSILLPGESHEQRACQAAVHRVTKSQTWLKWLSMQRLRALNKYIPEEYVKAFYLHNEIFWCDKDKHPKLTQKIAWQRRERRLVWLFWWLVAEVGVKKGKRESKVCKLSADKYKRSQTLCSLLKVYLALFGCI